MLIKSLALAAVLAAGASSLAAAQAMDSPKAPPGPALPTPDYLTAAGQSDQFEIAEGKLAQSMGKSPAIKDFGRQMVNEHMKSTDMVVAAVKKSGMSPPPPPPLRADQQAMIDQLRATSGKDFDRTYVQQQMAAHQEALKVQSDYAANGADSHLKDAAGLIVPVVQHHIMMLNGLAGQG